MNRAVYLAILVGFLAVSAVADDLRIRIDDVFTDSMPIEGETFKLTVRYTISNAGKTSERAEDIKLELDLPDSVVGKQNKTIPSVRVAAGTSVTEFAYFTDLKAVKPWEDERIAVKLSVKDLEPSIYSYTFDIISLPKFKVDVYPETPALGEKVKISGDIWPVITDFVGTDIYGEKIIIQHSERGKEYGPQPVMIITDWGTYHTFTNQFGRFEYWIPTERPGESTVTVSVGDNVTTATIDVQGFKVQMQVVPDFMDVGETTTIIGRVNLPYPMTLPVLLQVGKQKYSVVTDNYGVFRKEIVMDTAGNFTITAMAEYKGMIGKANAHLDVIKPQEPPTVRITASLPTSALAGTTVIMRGAVDKGGIKLNAPVEIELFGEVMKLNSTNEGFVLSFVAPQDPGYYPITLRTEAPEGEGEEMLELRVIPYSEAMILINSDKSEYRPGDVAIIRYMINLTRPIGTDVSVRAMKYGKVLYEESSVFSESKTGNFTLTLDQGEYTVEVEALGARKSSTFRCFTPPEDVIIKEKTGTNITLAGPVGPIEVKRIGLPMLVGAIALGIVLLV